MDHKRKTLNQFQIEDNREDSLNRSVDGLSSCCLTSAEVFPEMEQKNFFQCDMCDKILSRKDTLEVHKKTHTGIRFKCTECDSEYSLEDRFGNAPGKGAWIFQDANLLYLEQLQLSI